MLFDKLDRPDFEGMLPSEAWDTCEKYSDWVYSVGQSVSEEDWDKLLCSMDAVYTAYYDKYER